MENYGNLYTGSIKAFNGDTYDIWVQKRGYTGTSTTVSFGEPLIKYDSIKKNYEFLLSSGIEFSMISAVDREFINLFTNDIQLYKILLYKNSQYCGNYFLDTETYQEDFNQSNNYEVSFTANDGLKLLDRYSYLDANGNKYTGITSVWNILKNCLTKINYYNSNIYVNINTTIENITNSSTQTTLHNTYLKNNNYYDEDGEPNTCLEVVEDILQCFQLYLFQDYANGRFYLVDKQTLSNSSNSYKVYDMQGYNYQFTTSIATSSYDIDALKMASNSSVYSYLPSIKSQKINYNQYATDLIKKVDAKDEFYGQTSTTNYSYGNYSWCEYNYSGSTNMNKYNGGAFVKSSGTTAYNNDKVDYYFKIPANSLSSDYMNISAITKTVFKFKVLPEVTFFDKASNYRIKIGITAYFNTKNKLGDDSETGTQICYARLGYRLTCGNLCYYSVPLDWQWGEPLGDWRTNTGYSSMYGMTYFEFAGDNQLTAPINDSEQTNIVNSYDNILFNKKLPLKNILSVRTSDLSDALQLEILSYCYAIGENLLTPVLVNVKDVRIKNITLSIVDANDNTISTSNILHEAYLDEKNSKKGNEIKTIIGTNINKIPIAKGSLMYYDAGIYKYIRYFIRNDNTNYIEKLNLEEIVSYYGGDYYQNPRITLDCTTNILPTLLSKITYSNYLSKTFQVVGIEVNLAESITKIKLNEL